MGCVSSGLGGKHKERDAFQGRISRKSKQKAIMEKEHDDMIDE